MVLQLPAAPLQTATVRLTSDSVTEPATMANSWLRLGSWNSNLQVPVLLRSVGERVQKIFAVIVPGLPRAMASVVTGPLHKPWISVSGPEHELLALPPPPPPHLHASAATNASQIHGRHTDPRGLKCQVRRSCLPGDSLIFILQELTLISLESNILAVDPTAKSLILHLLSTIGDRSMPVRALVAAAD